MIRSVFHKKFNFLLIKLRFMLGSNQVVKNKIWQHVTLYLELLSSDSDLNVSFAQNKSAVVMWYKVVALKN